MNGSRKSAVGGGRPSFSDKVQRDRPRDAKRSLPRSQEKSSIEPVKEEKKEPRSRLDSHSSVSSSFSYSGLPVVMSTPKRNTRQSSVVLDSPSINRSNSILSMSGSSKKKFHKNYDPNIELRQVNERLSKRNSTSWAEQSLLHDEQDEDLQKYDEKCKRQNKNFKIVKDTEKLAQRQADIDKGKVKQCYKNYVYSVNKMEREPYMPRTPNKFIEMSRRAWDGMVRKWKKHIHAWNEPAPKKVKLSDKSAENNEYQYGIPPFVVRVKGADHNICGNDVFKFFQPLHIVSLTMNYASTFSCGELFVEFKTESDAHRALIRNQYPLGDNAVELLLQPIIYDYGHKELPFLPVDDM